MIYLSSQLPQFNFDQFLDWYPLKSEYCYELHNGNIIQMPKPKGKHSQIAGFLMSELSFEIKKLNLPYFIPRECIIKVDEWSGYEPDVIVLDKVMIKNESRWEKESTVTCGNVVKLVVEVVSTNWSDDYALKLEAYESLGIQEYWVVDYLGLGGRRFIGFPKQPTLTIYSLFEGQYQAAQFRQGQPVKSPSFPSLILTTQEIFQGAWE